MKIKQVSYDLKQEQNNSYKMVRSIHKKIWKKNNHGLELSYLTRPVSLQIS